MITLRRVALAAAAVLMILGGVLISTTPLVQPRDRPTAQDIRAARAAWHQLKAAQRAEGPTRVLFDDATVGSMVTLASDVSGLERVEAHVSQGTLFGRTSVPLPLGLWINVSAEVTGSHEGFPPVRTKVGHINIPTIVVRWLAEGGRLALRLTGTKLPPLNEMIRRVNIADQAVVADLSLPFSTGTIDGLLSARASPINHKLVADIFCRLAAAERAQPAANLSSLLRRAFKGVDDTDAVEYNRATFIALSFLVVGEQAQEFVPQAAEMVTNCDNPRKPILLRQRVDLAKHWVFSAALTSVLGQDGATNLGEWKELEDSLANGSGFSFVDLAADRSGVQVAGLALESASAEVVTKALSQVSEQQLLPDTLLTAPEGLEELIFVSRYGSLSEGRYKEALRWIDGELARHWGPLSGG